MAEKTITVELRQRSNYQFDIEFSEGMPQLMSDEPAPLGEGKGAIASSDASSICWQLLERFFIFCACQI
jgi:hypothetical protein